MDDKLELIAYIELMQTLIAMPVARSKFALHSKQKEGRMATFCTRRKRGCDCAERSVVSPTDRLRQARKLLAERGTRSVSASEKAIAHHIRRFMTTHVGERTRL